ncbi:SAVED domain-containing protein [Leifsonia soli]|uniref:Proteasome lid subunit RPN8/RPN11 n=1 Tax=Leifsonia soli TaxID=582665 RepID=A0A852T3M5_9MICO|nr:proteasome lid subunit RPN8/RPN11 [Leifsonia soli]
MKVVLRAAAELKIVTAIRRAGGAEAGGVLLGHFEDGDLIASDVLVVPGEAPSTHRYTRDGAQANALLQRFRAAHPEDELTGYVGEWHSHPVMSSPSGVDKATARAIARDVHGSAVVVVAALHPVVGFSAVEAVPRRLRPAALTDVVVERSENVVEIAEGSVDPDGPIFISYRQSDGTEDADTVSRFARAAGLVVWRDHRDLRPGTTVHRLREALKSGLSGAVLVVTKQIECSTIVREVEAPALVALDEDSGFALSVANTLANPDNPAKVDFSAPDRILGFSDGELAAKKQSDIRTVDGVLEIIRDQVRHRVAQRKDEIADRGDVFTLEVQSRPEPTADDASGADLHIRLDPSPGRLPDTASVRALAATFPFTGDAIHMSRATTVEVRGGMHLSLALALGAALPETKFSDVRVVDSSGLVWGSGGGGQPPRVVSATVGDAADRSSKKIAVHIGLGSLNSGPAFDRLVASGGFTAAYALTVDVDGLLSADDGVAVAAAISAELKSLSADADNAEVHLAFHGPFPLAVLVGRRLNTLQVVAYEWDNPSGEGPAVYVPSVRIVSGLTAGPITEVLLR